MDAVTVNEEGEPYLFKGKLLHVGGLMSSIHLTDNIVWYFTVTVNSLWRPYFLSDDHVLKGLYVHPGLSRGTFAELGRVDAAFCMHNKDNQADHDHMFFFSVRSSLWLSKHRVPL